MTIQNRVAKGFLGGAALGMLACAVQSFAAASPDKKKGPAEREKSAAKIDFIRDIRPILTDNCFACHGPDDKQRKANLRLDKGEEALKPAKSGDLAIVPGDVARSKLVERISSQDPDEVMPPPKTKKKLTAQQIDLLKRWIASG